MQRAGTRSSVALIFEDHWLCPSTQKSENVQATIFAPSHRVELSDALLAAPASVDRLQL
jgi:hypothetical protein